MQGEYHHDFVNPSSLNLQRRPISVQPTFRTNLDSTNRLLGLDPDHFDRHSRSWSHTDNYQAANFLDDFDFLEEESLTSVSAPAKKSDVERFDLHFAAQQDESPWVRERGPRDSLHQTFALSAPGPGPASSQEHQIHEGCLTDGSSKWTLDLTDTEVRQLKNASHFRSHQFPFRTSKTRDGTGGGDTDGDYVCSRLTMPGTAQSQHSHQTRHQSFNTGPQSIIESSATSSVSDNPPEIYSLSHATDYTQREWHADTLRQGDGSMLEGMAATRDFHQRLPHEFAIDSSSHWQSWPTSEASSFVGEQFSPTPEPVHMMDRPKMITDQMLRAPSHHDAVFDPADDKLNDQRSQLDHPRAIRIQGSSGRYQPDLTSTFPPTADRFPDYREVSHKQRQNHATIASQSVNISRSASKVQLGRKNSSRTPSARSSTSGSMVIIRENVHKSPSISRTISMKGKRNGPLSPATAQAAAQKRKEKNVCIRCRSMKTPCKGNLPCEGCQKNSNAKVWDQPCTPADFIDMIRVDTCNAVLQSSFSHLTIDKTRRVTVPTPENFDVLGLLEQLESCQLRYNIGVDHSSGSSYTLHLANCFRTMSRICKIRGLEVCTLDDLVNNKVLGSSDWLLCIKDCNTAVSIIDQSIDWNNMPSRNTYSISPLNKAVPSYALNVEDRQGRDRIVLAVQLSRILLRVLEVEAFKALQKSVNEVTKGSKSEANTAILANQLGRILSSLRWRISWWAVFGNGSNNPDAARIRFTERVTRLTQVLYFYYFLTKKRVSSSRDQLLVRVCSIYPDFPPVYEDLPQCETFEGFQAWMRQGEDMIHAVQMQQNMSRY